MIPSFSIGKLTQRGSIQTETEVVDDYGGRVRTWADSATVWMRIQPVSGDERVFGMQINDRVTHKITMRYTNITQKNRISHKGKIYNIRAILNEESRDRKLVLMVEEGVAT
jgi:SPP1 family predicted phage head-tail adaptor